MFPYRKAKSSSTLHYITVHACDDIFPTYSLTRSCLLKDLFHAMPAQYLFTNHYPPVTECRFLSLADAPDSSEGKVLITIKPQIFVKTY
jgi:hypothetical protein